MNQNETQWDKLLKIKTSGWDDSPQINTGIRMNQHLTWYWNDWQTVD